jgi:hypothetical protein
LSEVADKLTGYSCDSGWIKTLRDREDAREEELKKVNAAFTCANLPLSTSIAIPLYLYAYTYICIHFIQGTLYQGYHIMLIQVCTYYVPTTDKKLIA